MFVPVNSKQSFPEIEKEILKFWEANKIFEKSVEQRKGRKKYVFFDGPPFANGLPHYGHILANALKDAVTRYWTMKGYYVPRVNGWDCHGLPVEYEVEKELKISGRKQIEEFGVAKFNEKCRESVFRYTEEWEKLLKRIARWVDFEHSYATLENDYMESIWWVFRQIWDKGMVYKGYKSMHICPRCETPLSNFEVSQGYKDVTDLSIYVKFLLAPAPKGTCSPVSCEGEKVYVLAWTTTPWTLPGNVALAVGLNIKYVKVATENEKGEPEFYILAESAALRLFEGKKYKVMNPVNPKSLVGWEYEPIFPFYKHLKQGQRVTGARPRQDPLSYESKGMWRIYSADFVSTEEGTGVVHIAPAFGEDDYNLAQANKLPMIQHVGMDGMFMKEVTLWAGKFVKGQDQNIADNLAERDLLFRKENFRHSYPHCWRCDTPLLNYSTRSWFIKVTQIKDMLLKNNLKIHWQPTHIKEGRFGKWLEGARDWAISRNRYWGCPIPIWECSACNALLCVGSIDEMKSNSGGKVPMRNGGIDLHKPYIDEITFDCKKCGAEMKRIPEVLDCWFESGAMPYAQLHYPFDNKKEFEDNFPAHFIAEGLDQTRGWFYTLHILATILFHKPAFQNVIVNGILLAADGDKLSKRKKNYPDPSVLFDTRGVDATRYFLYSSTAPLAEDVRFSEKRVDEIVKGFMLTLWNAYSFFVTYASIDKWDPSHKRADFKPKYKLDQWILSELHQLITDVTSHMDNYNLTLSTRPFVDFVDNLSNWYIRRSRRRFWKSENDQDKFEAYQTLYTVLVTLSQLLAPFMPYIADAMYRNLTKGNADAKESVHLADWPKVKRSYIRPLFNEEVKIIRSIVTLGHAVRAKAGIRVRQPLKKVQIAVPESIGNELVLDQKDVVMEELNVKELEMVSDVADFVTRVVTPNPKVLGPKYGKDVQKIIQLCKEGKFEIREDGRVEVDNFVLEKGEFELGYKGQEGYDVESKDGISVILDTEITSELHAEGHARGLVRLIQEMRKEAGYNVSDRIYVWIESAGEIERAVTQFADYIRRETLATELQQKGDFEWDLEKEEDVEGIKIKLGIRKAL